MYPQSNSARSVRDLSGVWDFRFNANEPWQPIAVPASYNDQSPDPEFRRHYGMAYYRTTFTVPEGARRVLRFDAVTHNAVVRLNGQEIASHRGGFLPFEADITALAQPGETVTLDVEVDNRIGHSSLPVGNEGGTAFFGSDNAGIPAVEAGKARQQAQGINLPNFDFFNYAGITRPVHLYTTPAAYIRDVTVAADMTGTLRYTVDTVGEGSVKVEILDAEDRVVACADGAAGTVQVENARLWQPRPGTPYLYTALVKFGKDEYRQKFGFRSVEVSGHKFLINGAPFYFKGPCKHEDSAFRGRGYDACVTVTDLKLYEWLNANCLRMSHYPYAEEVYDLCDRLGIVVIDETPAVGIGAGAACDPYQTFPLKTYHSAVLRAMIERDKNHPCVVLWSLGNEPDTEHFPESARDYWRPPNAAGAPPFLPDVVEGARLLGLLLDDLLHRLLRSGSRLFHDLFHHFDDFLVVGGLAVVVGEDALFHLDDLIGFCHIASISFKLISRPCLSHVFSLPQCGQVRPNCTVG